jgi:hypothetical protein
VPICVCLWPASFSGEHDLAAIQGLNQKLKDKDAQIQSLEQRLERLEKLMANPSEKP